MIYVRRTTRMWRAILILVVAVVVAPVVFFLPPHFVWPLVVLGLAGYLAYRSWVGEYHVVEFEGECPRCGSELELPENARIRARHSMECYGCHRHPELIIDDPDA